jgi:TatD DNase family protein
MREKLTDTHAHLFWDSFQEDFDEIMKHATEAGISTIVNVGVDIKTSKKALKQIDIVNWPKDLNVYSTIGIHPEEAIKYSNSDDTNVSIHHDIDRLEEIYLSNPIKVVAVGECGLDFLFANQPWGSTLPKVTPQDIIKLQIELFQAQIDLAKKLNIPLLVHCRDDRTSDPNNSDAWDMVLKMVGDYPTLLHCYSGLPSTTDIALKSPNLIFSFAGNITYPKNEYLREAAALIPLDRIVLETDCPFLPPQSIRGKRNEPASVLEIAETIAKIKETSLEEVATQTTNNVAKALHLS